MKRVHRHYNNFGLFMFLIALLALPVGSLGFNKIEVAPTGVLSIEDVKESTESPEPEILEEGIQAPTNVVPFYR